MSASKRSSPARDVRRKYPKAVCFLKPDGVWYVWPHHDAGRFLGTGRTRLMAWNRARAYLTLSDKA